MLNYLRDYAKIPYIVVRNNEKNGIFTTEYGVAKTIISPKVGFINKEINGLYFVFHNIIFIESV